LYSLPCWLFLVDLFLLMIVLIFIYKAKVAETDDSKLKLDEEIKKTNVVIKTVKGCFLATNILFPLGLLILGLGKTQQSLLVLDSSTFTQVSLATVSLGLSVVMGAFVLAQLTNWLTRKEVLNNRFVIKTLSAQLFALAFGAIGLILSLFTL
jgi:hypothetical protein